VNRARQWQGLALLAALVAAAGFAGCWWAEAHQGTTAEVGDQEPNRLGPDHGRELVGDHVDGLDRGRSLDPLEQRVKISCRTVAIPHAETLG
jgi:hypothetical protein